MTRHAVWPGESLGFHCLKSSYGDSQYCRLSILGQLQLLSRPFKTQCAERKPERFIRFFKDRFRRGKLLRQISSHSRSLRALSREDKCDSRYAFIDRRLPFFVDCLLPVQPTTNIITTGNCNLATIA